MKQGVAQFIGSCSKGCIVSFTLSGPNVANGVWVVVGEGVSVTVDACVKVGVTVSVAGRLVGVEDGSCTFWVGWIVGLTGVHPAKARKKIKGRNNQFTGFIIWPFLIIPM